jgi:Ni/Co efflux regulator RcnB
VKVPASKENLMSIDRPAASGHLASPARLALAALLALLALGNVAQARGPQDREEDRRPGATQRRDPPDRRADDRRADDRRSGQREAQLHPGPSNNRSWRDERGWGPDHVYRRGDRLANEYRHRQYVIDDWRSHDLRAPPRGSHWVRIGADYVLVAVATGIIIELLLAH